MAAACALVFTCSPIDFLELPLGDLQCWCVKAEQIAEVLKEARRG